MEKELNATDLIDEMHGRAKRGEKYEAHEMTRTEIEAAVTFANSYVGTFDYMLDMRRRVQAGQSLSAGMAKGVLNCMLAEFRRNMAAAASVEQAARPAVNLKAIVEFLGEAGRKLKWPKFHFIVDGEELVLRLAGSGVHKGAVSLVSRERVWNERFNADTPRWYGRIAVDGTFTRSSQTTLGMEAALATISIDPQGAAIEYAKLTGACSFCGRTLTDERSTEVGYGPVCADKYGLAWG